MSGHSVGPGATPSGSDAISIVKVPVARRPQPRATNTLVRCAKSPDSLASACVIFAIFLTERNPPHEEDIYVAVTGI